MTYIEAKNFIYFVQIIECNYNTPLPQINHKILESFSTTI